MFCLLLSVHIINLICTTVKEPNMYIHTETSTDHYIATLLNAGRKNIRIQQQYIFLKNSRNQETIPIGIRQQCKMQMSVKDPMLQTLVNKMMMCTASRMLDLLIDYYHNWSVRLREHYYKLVNEFKQKDNPENFRSSMEIVNQKIQKQKQDCEKNHTTKLNRDKTSCPKAYVPNPTTSSSSTKNETISPKMSFKSPKIRRKQKSGKQKVLKRKRKPVHKARRLNIKSIPLDKTKISQNELDKTVINLSSKTITNTHKFVFHLGESFAVTPQKADREKLMQDINNWATSLRMGYIYSKVIPKNTSNEEIQEITLSQRIKKFEKELNILPKQNKNFQNIGNHALELFISKVKREIAAHPGNHQNKPTPSNIDKETKDALNEMRNWDDTVIRVFDKGTGFFILDKEDYVGRVENALGDATTFKLIENPHQAVDHASSMIRSWTSKYSKDPECPGMTPNFQNWVIPTNNNAPGVNYMNPKAHKPEESYPGRLISTGCNSYVKNLSIFTAKELKKSDLKYCLRDRNDLLYKLHLLNESGTLNGKTVYHVTLDVESMFPSISKDMGLPACRKHLDKRENKLFSTECVIDALEITLDNNITKFNNKCYVQTSGTAMGPNNACDYADVALDDFDNIVNDDNNTVGKPEFYGRHRDDIYILWTDTLEKLKEFLKWINNYHPNLRFTMSIPSLIGAIYLDLYLYSKNFRIEYRTSSKPSDSHSYLLPQSCHPTHIAENIPYGVAHRVFTTCSEPEEYEKCKTEFMSYLEKRNYNRKFVIEAFERAEKLDRISIISGVKNNSVKYKGDRCYPLVCDFNPAYPPVGRIINKNKFLLKLDPLLVKTIPPEKIFVSYRGNKTIKELLVPSKMRGDNNKIDMPPLVPLGTENNSSTLSNTDINSVKITPRDKTVAPPSSNINEEKGCYHCESKCKACLQFVCSTKTAKSYHSDYIVNISSRITCDTPGVCYLINDKLCRRSSVGSTLYDFKTRWRNHKSHIRKDRKTCEISKHFNSEFHNLIKEPLAEFDTDLSEQLEVILIEAVNFSSSVDQNDKIRILKQRESYWQQQLNTFECFGGLNKRDSCMEI